MTINLDRAASFMATHARILDRRRFDLARGGGDADRAAVVAAVDGYRNPDGGYGWGLEPDLRARESQPGGALHAFEAIADAGPATSPHTTALLDWLGSVSLPDGGVPFALPVADPTACAPFWVQADAGTSSLQITAAIATQAHRVAQWDAAAKDHPWLAAATRYCFDEIRRMDEPPFAYVLMFAVHFLSAAAGNYPEAHELVARLGKFIPADGAVPVAGGAEGESLHLLDLAPEPDHPLRALFDDSAVSADLDRLEGNQQPDGGWVVDFTSYSEAAALEWRGYATVSAISVLEENGR